MEKATSYRIKVLGELDAKWSDRLGGMSITIDRKERQRSVTKLVGPLRDQAALAGVLSALYELHLPVLSVECLDKETN
jgi:hypothetical protein